MLDYQAPLQSSDRGGKESELSVLFNDDDLERDAEKLFEIVLSAHSVSACKS